MKSILKILLALLLIGAFVYAGREISRLSDRIQEMEERLGKVENKLGGTERIACNEKDTIGKVRRSVVRIVGGESEGSGFAFEKGGMILTNFHVIDMEPNPKVILPDNTFETARVIMADKDADLAVIKIKKDLPVLPLAPVRGVSAAEEVFAIGYPLGGSLPGEASVIRGSFSRFTRDKETGLEYALTDMTMVSGISGGPMVNICGEVIGVNTSGLLLGGMGIAISAETVRVKYRQMSESEDPLEDVKRTVYEPNKNALEAVRAFYNYLKARKLEKAFELLSGNFVGDGSYERWAEGYRPLLDTTVLVIRPDREVPDRIKVKLSTKDLKDGEIVYKFFEGYWDVRQIEGKWRLWKPRIREVKEPDENWNLDQELIAEIEEFGTTHEDYDEYAKAMYDLAHEPGNEKLSVQELYDRVKGK